VSPNKSKGTTLTKLFLNEKVFSLAELLPVQALSDPLLITSNQNVSFTLEQNNLYGSPFGCLIFLPLSNFIVLSLSIARCS
jgi:hypothetical protein